MTPRYQRGNQKIVNQRKTENTMVIKRERGHKEKHYTEN